MKPFHFTLQAVRTVRQRQEQQAREQYAQASRAQREARDQLKGVEADLARAWEQISHRLPGGISAADLLQLHGFARVVEERRQQCVERLTALSEAFQRAAEAWRAARRACEVVDKCCQRQKSAYQRKVLAEEQKLLDDLANRDRAFSSLGAAAPDAARN